MDLEDALERVSEGRVVAREGSSTIIRPRPETLTAGAYMGWVATAFITVEDIEAEDWVDLGSLH